MRLLMLFEGATEQVLGQVTSSRSQLGSRTAARSKGSTHTVRTLQSKAVQGMDPFVIGSFVKTLQ